MKSLYLIASSVYLKENKRNLENPPRTILTIKLSSCRTIKLSDYRAVELAIGSRLYVPLENFLLLVLLGNVIIAGERLQKLAYARLLTGGVFIVPHLPRHGTWVLWSHPKDCPPPPDLVTFYDKQLGYRGSIYSRYRITLRQYG